MTLFNLCNASKNLNFLFFSFLSFLFQTPEKKETVAIKFWVLNFKRKKKEIRFRDLKREKKSSFKDNKKIFFFNSLCPKFVLFKTTNINE